jgi:MFS family permease
MAAAMKLPNLLASRGGRLVAFFFLYVTEGIPLGFTATAVATQMRRDGLGPAEIGVFVGTLYLPWSWKWLMGPVVDLVYSKRLGRRRGWIVITQVMMSATLLSTMFVDFSAELRLFTVLILVVNVFGASQDVAIDALACGVLEEHERGLANGLMFAGAYSGQALGGAGVLYLAEVLDFRVTFLVVAGLILSVTLFVVLPMRESPPEETAPPAGGRLRAIAADVLAYLRRAAGAIFGSRGALMAGIFAVLPTGAYGLSLALQANLAVELGLSDSSIATLALLTTITSAVACVVGGYLSDRLGRRLVLAAYIGGAAAVTLAFAWYMQRHGWIMPIDPDVPDRPTVPPPLVTAFWVACTAFAVFHGLLYGTRTALFMDVCTPAVAATQFTAYMSLLNLVIWYTATWQGFAIERWGYPVTLTIDAAAGLVCLATLPWIRKR